MLLSSYACFNILQGMRYNAHDKTLIILPPVFAGIAILISSVFLQACYTISQGAALFSLLGSSVPVNSISGTESEFVRNIEDIRQFATDTLGLKQTKNYTTYVEIGREYLAAVVSASEKDKFKGYEWSFPIVGKVPYKGYFDIKDALKETEKLKKKDLDVIVRRVDAFSLLGWFKDPLYSFMKDYSVTRLSDLIIHESFHSTLFLKNHVSFNEELAEFVGTEGAKLYIEQKFGIDSEEYKKIILDEKENSTFITYIKELILELDRVYKSNISREEKLYLKEKIIAESQSEFANKYNTLFKSERYRFFSSQKINNAYLELYRLYHGNESRIRDLYTASGSDLPAFITAAKSVNNSGNPYEQLARNLHINV